MFLQNINRIAILFCSERFEMMKKMKILAIALVSLLVWAPSWGKELPAAAMGRIEGKVVDKLTGDAVEYATISLYNTKDELIGGIISDANGYFSLVKVANGAYYIKVSFLGYQTIQLNDIEITPRSHKVELGSIAIEAEATAIDEVVVEGAVSSVNYKIDKKVVQVSQQLAAVSGTAVDVLEQVPSVKVDIEGNVTMRGSSGFSVLIDGKPSILDPNDALRQIPASSIANIELITNPSVKYDPDGTAGIINIVTKRRSMQGLSGIANLNVGMYEKYGGDFLLNYRKEKVSFYLGADYNSNKNPGDYYSERESYSGDSTYHVNSDGTRSRSRSRLNLRTGMDYQLTKKDQIGIGLSFSQGEHNWDSELDYEEWTEPGTDRLYYTSVQDGFRGGTSYNLQMFHKHDFNDKGHNLLTTFDFGAREMDEGNETYLYEGVGQISSGSKNTEFGPSHRYILKMEYTLPFSKESKLEAGGQVKSGQSTDETELYFYDTELGDMVIQPEYTHKTVYYRDIYSLYGMYSNQFGRLGFQGGLRSEYTNRDIETDIDTVDYSRSQFDFFPSLHFSYELLDGLQAVASYSRRIERPRSWYLEPFIIWQDAYNVRRGNPDLDPEYIDSYEAGLIYEFGKNMLSAEAFYRVTHDKIQRLHSQYEQNVILHTFENIGQDFSLGSELALRMQVANWWQTDLSNSLYHYRIEGEHKDRTSFNWDARWNNNFRLAKQTRFQLNTRYNSPSVTSEGETEGYFVTDASLKQNFMKNKAAAVLQVRDVFGTSKHAHTTNGETFEFYSKFDFKTPVVMLTLTYNFNNYNAKGKKSRNGGGNDDEF